MVRRTARGDELREDCLEWRPYRRAPRARAAPPSLALAPEAAFLLRPGDFVEVEARPRRPQSALVHEQAVVGEQGGDLVPVARAGLNQRSLRSHGGRTKAAGILKLGAQLASKAAAGRPLARLRVIPRTSALHHLGQVTF